MSTTKDHLDFQIQVAGTADEVAQAFEPMCHAFGHQTRDGVFIGTNPGWDTPAGKQKGAARLAARFTNATTNRDGKPNTVFLLATVADPAAPGLRAVAGMAVWEQASVVPGHGDPPTADEGADLSIQELYPDDPAQQRHWAAVMRAMHRQRWATVRAKAAEEQPALMVLDICAVDPRYQGRGIGAELVRWGLREARERGDLEAVTEASVMGRRVYMKLGFEQDGPETVFDVDASVSSVPLPSIVFLRTKKP
ncbi:Acyl-CoA N-acyltransferase [Cordyceps fumosorosea ARSEF 2679]|uniref:Acyl-CoA N-acyltransferase n=1 Tax=Cordyceps fumosorosea (strain ARSEF 2679) TaxID=1081104 RepID=A0A167QZT8_CORFA|nr:Acyl-CoA N-acyltransferase [Cordyceps fumosorosea ARSEF 2679]OAA58138.1 Acyl-CoA N-acyltransferase [Cordyceps fumosorosea ARSEF 2679]